MRAANRRHQLQRAARARPPTSRWPTPGRMPPRNCRATKCWRASSPGWKTPSTHKLGQHVKYDRHVFANHGIEVQGYAHDTMLQSYVLEVHKPHGLASLAERHTGPHRHQLRRPVRQGRAPDPVCPGAGGQAPPPTRAKTPTRPWTCTTRCGRCCRPTTNCASSTSWRCQQRGAVPHRAQRRADRRAHAGRAKPRAGPAHPAAGNRGV
jgi:hypothetical protein